MDASSNSYTTGVFVGRLFVRNNNLTSLSDATYIIALDSTATPIWAFKFYKHWICAWRQHWCRYFG